MDFELCFQNFGDLSKNQIFSENLPPLLAHLHAALTFEPLWGKKLACSKLSRKASSYSWVVGLILIYEEFLTFTVPKMKS